MAIMVIMAIMVFIVIMVIKVIMVILVIKKNKNKNKKKNFETSLDHFINDWNKMFYIKRSRLKIEQCGAKWSA